MRATANECSGREGRVQSSTTCRPHTTPAFRFSPPQGARTQIASELGAATRGATSCAGSGADGGQTSASKEQLAGRDAALDHWSGRRSIGLIMSPRTGCRGGWMRGCRSCFRAQGWRVVERASLGNEKLPLSLGPRRRAPVARRQCHHFSGSARAMHPQRDDAHTGHASSDTDRSPW